MSKVNIEFDTESKELAVSMDGERLENVRDICFYRDWEDKKKFMMGIAQVRKNENGTTTWTQTSAQEVSVASVSETGDKTNLVSAVAKMFSKK